MSSQSSHHHQEVFLAQFSLYVHKGCLKPDSFHFISLYSRTLSPSPSSNVLLRSSQRVRVVIPTGRYSDRSIFRQVVIPTGRYSDKQVVIPTARYSDRSIFRQAVRYSDRSLFRQVDSPTNRSLFRQFDSSTKRLIFRKVYIPTGRYSDIKIIVMRGLTTINSYCGDE